jgi:predicted RNase H-like nuclease
VVRTRIGTDLADIKETDLVIVAGADVWKGKWVVVILDDGHFSRGFVAATFAEVVTNLNDVSIIGVDIPIGLPMGADRRVSDIAARAFVGSRRNSVFFTPPAELLDCTSAAEANDLARRLNIPGIAAQTFALKKQILAVQPFAEQDGRIYEVHPEVSFREACGEEVLWPKSSWNGQMVRRTILANRGINLPQVLPELGGADPSDILDASIVAWSASRIAKNLAERFPTDGSRLTSIWR